LEAHAFGLKGERNTLKRATLLSPLDIIYNIGY
jgi:excinuclease UvrABC nuclease subunit